MKKLRVLIAGGGTGGHVLPALAVAAELRRRGHEVLMVGTARGMELRLAAASGIPLELIEVGALNRVGVGRAFATLLGLPRSLAQAARVIERFRPAVAFGVGGYASGPVMLMAAMKDIPVVTHEPNAIPGFANRLMAPYVARALVAFPDAARFFPATRVETAGVPVRAEFFAIPPKPHRPPLTILVSGGSQGSQHINQAVIESLPLFREAFGAEMPFFIHQTGERGLEAARAAFAAAGLDGHAEVSAFIQNMPAAFARADLLVCRSGAATVAEIAAAGKAAVLVPFPYAADDHQLRNAGAFERAGAARILLDADLSGRALFDAVREVAGRLQEMERNARALAQPQSAERIADVLEAVGSRQ